MSKKNDTSGEQSTSSAVSRRRLIQMGVATGGSLLVGASALKAEAVPGRQGAPGRGGEAIVDEGDYRPEERFEITGFNSEADRKDFQCEGQGRTISFPAWNIEYVESGETGLLYTRDNNVDTDSEYKWRPLESGAKDCGGNLIQTPFYAVK